MSQYYSFVTTGKTIINIRDMINYKLYIESALQIINCYREEKYEVSEKIEDQNKAISWRDLRVSA